MKKLILTSFLLITAVLSAQNLSNLSNKEDAIKVATELVNASNGLKFEASQLFTEENKLVVKFTNSNSYALVLYKNMGDFFVFESITSSYENMLPIWNKLSNNSTEKFFDKINKIIYYFSEDNDDKWIITKQSLK